MSEKIKIIIADDHAMFRDGLKALLNKEKLINVCGDSDNELDIMKLVKEQSPNVVLMDIDMGATNGIELTKKIRTQYSAVNVLAISMHGDQEYVIKMLEAGAMGYILKNSGKEEMLNAIKCIANGETYLSQEVSKCLMLNALQKSKPSTDIPLTKREIEVLQLITQEFSNAEIANKLFVSTRTIDTHRRNLMEKLDVKNTAGLVRYAYRNKLID
ncbi:response regulator transcription factor [Ancylomarina sp. 16SWW S1-10-2]|uniref:response regulator n=1 Tax=Ancylomarina sp. 16SWW S1-10-2 TaxID=2499681 RepID=UPI0012AE5C7F|nr:response regulator transcription factor [Ancylomarina sp. 16SWW S1-10-2]MRT93946.1 response regulator transcription factor [Ancylomarina sp. 16SWW S1-10-2]